MVSREGKHPTPEQQARVLPEKERETMNIFREQTRANLLWNLNNGNSIFVEKDLQTYLDYPGAQIDGELKEAAKTMSLMILKELGDESAASVFRQYNKLCKDFGLSPNWAEDPQMVEIVRESFLRRLKSYRLFDSLSQLIEFTEFFKEPIIAEDLEIKKAVQEKVFAEDADIKGQVKFFKSWGVGVESFRDRKVGEFNKGLSYSDQIRALGVFRNILALAETCPEIAEDANLRRMVYGKIKNWDFESWSAGEMNSLFSYVKDMAELFKFPAEMLVIWGQNFLKGLLVTGNSGFTLTIVQFRKASELFKLEPADLQWVKRNAFLQILNDEKYEKYHYLSQELGDPFEHGELQAWGQLAIQKELALSDPIPSVIEKIQNACSLPLDFFKAENIHAKLIKAIAKRFIYNKSSSDLDRFCESFGLGKPDYQEMDREMLKLLSSGTEDFGNYLGLLGVTTIQERFPEFYAAINKKLLVELETNATAAIIFIERYLILQEEPWAKEALFKAIQFLDAAENFLTLVKEKRSELKWSGSPRLDEVIKQAKATVVAKSVEKIKEDGEKGFIEPADEEGKAARESRLRYGATNPYLVESISKILAGEDVAALVTGMEKITPPGTEQEIEKPLTVELSPEAINFLILIAEKVKVNHQLLIEKITTSADFPKEDRRALLGLSGGVKMNNLLSNLRAFTARYIVQLAEYKSIPIDQAIRGTANVLEDVLKFGIDKFFSVFRTDIPLYDVLYEEFDDLRSTGRRPTEVYLGRDGIYAYIGRRAQDAIRRSKAHKFLRKGLIDEEEGRVEINPKYLVFPTLFKEDLNYEVKKEYLEQERVGPDADPIFYDTGFAGSIPEHIMRLMGFDYDEVEKRIKLLSARQSDRRVRRLRKRYQAAVHDIEDNPKTEDTAFGLYKDPDTGKITHLAEPASPKEQFAFSMIKQAIARHYLVKESLHFEPTKNVQLDFERRQAVVNKDFLKRLPREFLSDPEQFLSERGLVLKEVDQAVEGSTGVFSVPLADGTELVVKRVSSVFGNKDAQAEFCLLAAAKKAGLATAEPVALISDKERGMPKYVVMTKVKGMSGQEFNKYLQSEKLRGANISVKTGQLAAEELVRMLAVKNIQIATEFREKLGIDKQWKLEDLMIDFDEEGLNFKAVVPIDWSEIHNAEIDQPKFEVCIEFQSSENGDDKK